MMNDDTKRVLFILKLGEAYGSGAPRLSSGLYNSARFVVQMLQAAGIAASLVQVIDNNDIDREVAQFKPTHVVIEGLWVVPEKFPVLRSLHPSVTWIVRIHSEVPFLATEGVATGWIARYVALPKVFVAMNSMRGFRDIQNFVRQIAAAFVAKVLLLPNFYPRRTPTWTSKPSEQVHIGCFGSIRPLKNQLAQALAAMEFASSQRRQLVFYVNSRNEQDGNQVLKNLESLFANTHHRLVSVDWLPHDQFLEILQTLDAGMAVSFSESFCICAADMVSQGIPVVVSPEIQWASKGSHALPTVTQSMVATLDRVTGTFGEVISWANRKGLEGYSERSRRTWLSFAEGMA